jgi:uncharacterized protein YcbX
VGTVQELWRYPVKSLGGERLEHTTALPDIGLPGDRGWAIRDETALELRSARNWPGLLELRAEYLEEPVAAATPPVRIHLPTGQHIDTHQPDADALLGKALDKLVSLHPRVPADQKDHFRRREPITDMAATTREASELLPDEPLPSFSDVPVDISVFAEYISPPGTYFDYFQLHLLTTRSLETLAGLTPASQIDARRFRPNLLIEVDDGVSGFPEIDWCGKGIAIGRLELQIVMPMMRCAMTTHAQGELPKDPTIMRTLVRESGMNLGVGAQILQAGEISVGDELVLFEFPDS